MQPPVGLDGGFAVLGFCGAGAGLAGEGGHVFPFAGTHAFRPFVRVIFALAHSVQSKGVFAQTEFPGARPETLFDQTEWAGEALSCLFP